MADVSELTARVEKLESQIDELQAIQNLLLRLLSTTRPLSKLLEQFSATDTQEQALFHLLDDLCVRARGAERDRPSFSYFERHVGEIFSGLRGDREFLQLLIDTLKVERPAYRELHEYMTASGWLV